MLSSLLHVTPLMGLNSGALEFLSELCKGGIIVMDSLLHDDDSKNRDERNNKINTKSKSERGLRCTLFINILYDEESLAGVPQSLFNNN